VGRAGGARAGTQAPWGGSGGRCSYTLNVWDVGGQRSIRSYWRNYFEQTDGLVWVVDAADAARLPDCRRELHALLQEEVREEAWD
jgi:GTPase SAR1 family protein